MLSLLATAGAYTVFILTVESVGWTLFRRKMEQLDFPIGNDLTRSHTHNLERLQILSFAHTIGLILFVWMFCAALWW